MIITNDELITHLSTDRAFGILTRPAFEYALAYNPTGLNLFCIDFDGIHNLNKLIGYQQVNRIFKSIFESLHAYNPNDTITIGRVFSGDEIAINSPSHIPVMEGLLSICRSKEIGFKYVKGNISYVKTIDDATGILDGMSVRLQQEPNYYSLIN